MLCRKCKQEMMDCNEFVKDSPVAKKIGMQYDPKGNGLAYMCINPKCKKYGNIVVKGLDFDKPYRFPFLHKFHKLSRR